MKRNCTNVVGKCGLVVLLLLSLLLCACAEEPAVDEVSTTGETEETQPTVQVAMPNYEFTYSGTLSEKIAIKELEDTNNLEFTVKIGEETYTIFVLHFNAEGGDLVEFITDGQGNKIPVSFEMMPLPDGLQDDEALLFYQAQESVNDIVASIQLK